MSDTIQMVRWSLGSGTLRSGYLWLPERRQPLEEVLWESIRRAGVEERMRAVFQVTRPLWYGLWIDSPLSAPQCAVLRAVFQQAARLVPGYGKHLDEFTQALADSIETGEPLHVELTPPGHADFGWITTFVHCPRCKAEGPVKRWQPSYAEEPIACPVCGHEYSPAATHSSERELFAETVSCPSCGAVHRVRELADDAIQTLEDRHTLDEFHEELTWLRRVEAFYTRHPDLEGQIKPHVLRLLESPDPAVREELFAGTPLADIALPPGETPSPRGSGAWSREDEEVADYLRHNHFSLNERKQFVEQSIERLGRHLVQAAPVKCTGCGTNLT